MSTTGTLKLTTTRCRCSGCGEHFNSPGTFERHRVGPFAPINEPDTRRCLTPEELRAKGLEKNEVGFWARPSRFETLVKSVDETRYWAADCSCGWVGTSKELVGEHLGCPKCGVTVIKVPPCG